MKDLALHLFDIIENSAKAGAPRLSVDFSWSGSVLHIRLADNGPGLPAQIAADPTNPYTTTRTERPVGLGLAFLRQSAEESGGRLEIDSRPGSGVTLDISMDMAHVDARPPGDLEGVLATAAAAWPGLAIAVGLNGGEPFLDMDLVKRELDGLPLDHPAVREFVAGALREGLAPLRAWLAGLAPRLPTTATGNRHA